MEEILAILKKKIFTLANKKPVNSQKNWLYCYKNNVKNAYAYIQIGKKKLTVHVKPKDLYDPKNITRESYYKPTMSAMFEITDKSEIDYAMQLIKQSYDLE
jgi:predicted transport protein